MWVHVLMLVLALLRGRCVACKKRKHQTKTEDECDTHTKRLSCQVHRSGNGKLYAIARIINTLGGEKQTGVQVKSRKEDRVVFVETPGEDRWDVACLSFRCSALTK